MLHVKSCNLEHNYESVFQSAKCDRKDLYAILSY